MKYAMNHQYKFTNWEWAYLCGFFKSVSGICVEIASIGIICSSSDAISIGQNFIALFIVTDFDDIVVQSLLNESYRKMLEPEFYNETLKV